MTRHLPTEPLTELLTVTEAARASGDGRWPSSRTLFLFPN